ncbi:hypothetical protein R3P38DRAFT_3182492 [Favolaschia claudopus]|uniref:F-box domain-containing protein n=1 Tax=Favolaschia claudopus TaxID=2862362 RepID=A0AAW0CK52_9AGAR
MPSNFPNEIHIEILSHAVHMGRYWGERMQMRIAIALVCRLWNAILKSDASIWSDVVVRYGMPSTHVAFVLDRAARIDTPLNILVDTEAYSSGKSIKSCADEQSLLHWLTFVGPLFAGLTPRAERIEVRSFNQQAVRSILSAIKFSTSYAVSELFLAAPSPLDTRTMMPAPGRGCERLLLLGIVPFWEVSVYTPLTELRLAELTDDLHWPALRAVLQNCQALQTLGLTNVACGGTDNGVPISLSHLVALHFTYMSIAHVALLHLIATPAITELRVQTFVRRGWRELLNAVSPLLPSLLTLSLSVWSYSEVATQIFPHLHSVVCVDIGYTSHKFLEEMRDAVHRPQIQRLRKWIVPSGITVAQANPLLNWPGADIVALFEIAPSNKRVDNATYLRWTKVGQEFRIKGVRSMDI